MKQYYCFLEKFNNYFNRKIIKFETLSEYENNSESFFIPVDSNGGTIPFDFNPNDNVMTEIIVNDVPFDPDYFLLLDADSNIIQRWFVLEQKRNRQGQWVYQLRRDVIADNLDNLETAPIFVEKGMLSEDDPFIVNDEGMSLNQIKKSITLLKDITKSAWVVGYMAKNAVPTSVTVPVNTNDVKDYVTLANISNYSGISETVLANIIATQTEARFTKQTNIHFKVGDLIVGGFQVRSVLNYDDTTASVYSSGGNLDYFLYKATTTGAWDIARQLGIAFAWKMAEHKSALYAQMGTIMNRTFLTYDQLLKLQEYEGKTVLYNGNYYKWHISIRSESTVVGDTEFSYTKYSSIQQIAEEVYVPNGFLQTNGHIRDVITNDVLALIELQDSQDGSSLSVQLSSSKNVCHNQQFDMFCIPLNSINIYDTNYEYKTMEYAQVIAQALALQLDASIYDIQLLPYCPILDLYYLDNPNDPEVAFMFLNNLTEHEDFDIVYGASNPNHNNYIGAIITHRPPDYYFVRDALDPTHVDVILSSPYINNYDNYTTFDPATLVFSGTGFEGQATNFQCTFSYDSVNKRIEITSLSFELSTDIDVTKGGIDIKFTYDVTATPVSIVFYPKTASFSGKIKVNLTSSESKKVESNCNFYRLVSPNYQGTFDFNLAKNGGSCESMTYYCTYKPYTPFIKVCPELNFLYGQDYNDNRGLICAGDFSLPRITGAWESYQLQNKNYQNIFNRDIQNLDFMQSIERRNQIVSGAVGIVADTAKGAGAGAYVGGPAGALIGGAVGGITSGVGYAIDVDTLAKTQRETRQLAIDKYNYQLGNIKALPYTLTKVGSFDIASKIFPFLEYYTCSDKELEAFKSKIKYESMTVMRIGTLNEYMGFNGELNYFKGSLIRNDEIADDTHILNAIYEELLKGVYI